MSKKLITVAVPVFNEQENINEAYNRIKKVMKSLNDYEYEIVFFDDGSTDFSRQEIEMLSQQDSHVSAVFYERNFGYAKNIFYCVQQSRGDAVMLVHADMQNPPEEIPGFVRAWENGSQIVLGVKNRSLENKFIFWLRTLFYWMMNILFGIKLIPHATDFGLFDKSFVDILKRIKSNRPFLRGLILEYGQKPELVYYTQDRRNYGKTHFSLSKYYSFAIDGVVGYSKVLPHRIILCSLVGILVTLLEFFIGCLPKLVKTGEYVFASNCVLIHIAVILLFIVLIALSFFAEFIIVANENIQEKPLIVEEKRINY